jgi:P27 family predicted phage terminase small subunit
MAKGDLTVVDGAGGKPMAGSDPVEPPAWLSTEAADVWRALAPHTAAGTLTPGTAWTFAMLCTELATYAEAEQLVQDAGMLIADGQTLGPNPALLLRRQADSIAARWMGQFGLTPEGAAQLGGPADSGKQRTLPHLVEGG